MTIANDTAKTGPYYPDGVVQDFPFDFDVDASTDLSLIWLSSDGSEVPVSASAYGVTISASDPGGTVSFSTAPVLPNAADELWIVLDPVFEQQDRYSDEGPFNQSLLEGSIDKVARMAIALKERLDRTIKVPFGTTPGSLPVASARLGKFLGFSTVDGALMAVDGSDANSILAVDLLSTDAGKGAARIGVLGGGVLSDYIKGVSANAFGVVPDLDLDVSGMPVAPVDQAPALQAAIDFADANKIPTVFIKGPGVVCLGSTIEVPIGISIDGYTARPENSSEYGDGLRIVPLPDGEFATDVSGVTTSVAADGDCQEGYLFFFNVDPADTANADREFPNVGSGGLFNASIDGSLTGGISVAYFAGSHHFEHLRLDTVATGIKKPSGVYTDRVVIRDVFARLRANADDWLIDLAGTGDGYVIDGVSSGYTGAQTGIAKGVYVGNCRSGKYSNVINGIHEFRNCHGTAEEFHIEGGQVIVDQGAMTVRGCKFYNGDAAPDPILVRNSNAASLHHGKVTLEDNTFIHYQTGVADTTGWETSQKMDIVLADSRMDVTIGLGNRRMWGFNSALSRQNFFAPLIGTATGTILPKWEQVAPMLAMQGCRISKGVVRQSGTMPELLAVTGISSTPVALPAGADGFSGASATYFYAVDILTDKGRLIGRTGGAEISIAAVNASLSLPSFQMDWAGNPPGGFILRAYRGTATGSYDKYVDIPVTDATVFPDDGAALAGFAWKSRAAGAKDAINNGGLNGPAFYFDGRMELRNSAVGGAPTAGAWETGDLITMTARDHYGRFCSVGGSPGTWPKIGIVGAEKMAAIAAPAGGATIDAEARTQLSALITELKGKGLMAP